MTIAFVAGATGYTGRAVVIALGRAGVGVVAHVRPDSPRLEAWRTRFEDMGAEVDATAWDEEAMTARLTALAPHAVFGCLGTTKKRIVRETARGETPSYATVDYGLTALLHRAATECGSAPRFVYVSSAGVKPGEVDSYFGARWRMEQALINGALPYTIARPSFITGADRDEDRPMERLGAAMSDGALRLAGILGARRLRDRYRSTTNTTLGAALARLAFDAAAANRIIESEGLR